MKITDLVENPVKVYMVVKRKSKKVFPVRFYNSEFGCDMFATFPSRKQAQIWIEYWTDGKVKCDIVERTLF
jgi:hypothetical protein